MRNLKKILSLALALVMVMSLLTVAGAKDFNDADQIEHTEAVEVMSALGVISGMGNNTFDPKGNVTRAQMAKMITYISLGNVEPTAFLGTTTNLTDITGHWAEAYIKYCYSQGIIAGRGNGIFAPDANVTATEAARMLLVAIGYNADVQVYTGSQWNINVVRDAQLSHLYDDVSVTSTETLNRDKAAQMMYNALMTKTIEKSSSVDRVTGDITDIYTANGRPLLWKSYRAKVAIGTFVGNSSFAPSGSPLKGEIVVDEGRIENDDRTGDQDAFSNATFPYDFDIANIGEQVKVIFKDGTSGTAYVPDKNDTIFGVYKTGATSVVNTIMGNVKDQKTTAQKINLDGTKYDVANNVTVYTNYVGSGTQYSGATDGGTSVRAEHDGNNSGLTTALKQANGNTVKAVITDGKINKIYVTTSNIAAVTAVNSDKVSINNNVGTIEFEDNDIYSGIARGDIVVVTTLYNSDATDDSAYNIVVPAEVVSGTVNGFKGKENINLSGTTYKVHNGVNMLKTVPNKTTTEYMDGTRDVGENYDLYLVNGYVGAAIKTSESANNYAMVINVNTGTAGDTFPDLKLQILTGDGTKKIITVSDKSTLKSKDDYHVGDVVTYTGSESNATVTREKLWSSSTRKFDDTTKTIDGIVVADGCVLFAQTADGKSIGGRQPQADSKFETFDLRSLKTFEKPMIYVLNKAGNRIVAAVANYGSRPNGSVGNTVYGMITKVVGTAGVGEDNEVYTEITVTSGGEDHTLYLPKNADTTTKYCEKALVYFDPVSDNIYTEPEVHVIQKMNDDHRIVTGVYASELLTSGSDRSFTFYTAVKGSAGDYEGDGLPTTWALAKDCRVVYVDKDGKKAGNDNGGDVPEFSGTYGKTNAVVIYDADNKEILSIIVNTDGKDADFMAVDTTTANAGVTATIESELEKKGEVEVTTINFTNTPVKVPAGATLTVTQSATITSVEQITRTVTRAAEGATTLPKPAVAFKSTVNSELPYGFGNPSALLSGAGKSNEVAIYSIDVTGIVTGATKENVKAKAGDAAEGKGVDATIDGHDYFYLIVGNNPQDVITIKFALNGDWNDTSTEGNIVTITVKNPGWGTPKP